MSSIKDLCQVLQIVPPLEQSTCIGYGQRNPNCGCAVALSSRASADRTLRDISYDILAGNGVQRIYLDKIASLLLCKRFHQFQIDELVVRWTTALTTQPKPMIQPRQASVTIKNEPLVSAEQYRKLEAELRLIKEEKQALQTCVDKLTNGLMEHGGLEYIITGESRPIVRSAPPTSTDMQRISDALLIAEVGRRIESSPAFKTNSTLSNVTSCLHESQRSTQISTESGGVASARPQTADRIILSPRTRRRHAAIPRPEVLSTQYPSQNAEVPTDSSVGPVATAAQTSPAHTRHSHIECGACYESYDEAERNNYWECHACQNRTHTECFSAWVDAAGARDVRCIYCRANVTGNI